MNSCLRIPTRTKSNAHSEARVRQFHPLPPGRMDSARAARFTRRCAGCSAPTGVVSSMTWKPSAPTSTASTADQYADIYRRMPRIQQGTDNSEACIERLAELMLPGAVCDVGCGTGYLLGALAARSRRRAATVHRRRFPARARHRRAPSGHALSRGGRRTVAVRRLRIRQRSSAHTCSNTCCISTAPLPSCAA